MAQADSALPELSPQDEREPSTRYVVEAAEHGEIELPPDLIFKSGRLDVYPAVISHGLFRIKLERDSIALQAGGLIGFIPLNDRLAIEVRTRVPIANLEHMLRKSGKDKPLALPFIRSFARIDDAAMPFLDIIASHFCNLLADLHLEGLFKTYVRERHRSSSPAGRLLPLPTALAIATTGRPEAISERFERTIDNGPNRCIRFAHTLLSSIYRSRGRRAGSLKIFSRLRSSEGFFDGVPLDEGGRFLGDPVVQDTTRIGSNRPTLRETVELARLIATGSGVSVRSRVGNVLLPSILLRMDDIFEAYIRTVIAEHFRAAENISVRDGNLKPPLGAAGHVFDFVPADQSNVEATPDAVVSHAGKTVCVIETKYKPCEGKPARDDLNQAITYGVSFDCSIVVLAYPAAEAQSTGLTLIGRVGKVQLFRGVIALGTSDLVHEELLFCQLLADVLRGEAEI